MALTTNLVAYWKLDESSGNAADSVGSNTLTNSGVTYGTGKINNGAVYDSSTDKLEISDASQSGLDLSGDCSFSFWWKGTPQSHGTSSFIDKVSVTGDNRSYRLYFDNPSGSQTLEADIYQNGTGTIVDAFISSCSLSDNTWYHLAFTWGASTKKGNWYVNGSALGELTGSAATSIYNGTAPFRLGQARDSLNNSANGTLDEVGIWSRVLTSTEITELYNSGNGNQYPFLKFFTILDTLGITDAVTNLRGRLSTVSDNLSLVESTIYARGISFIISEVLALVESKTILRSWIATVSDTLGLTDIVVAYKKWTERTKNSASWTEGTKHTATFTEKTKHTAVWTERTKN